MYRDWHFEDTFHVRVGCFLFSVVGMRGSINRGRLDAFFRPRDRSFLVWRMYRSTASYCIRNTLFFFSGGFAEVDPLAGLGLVLGGAGEAFRFFVCS